MSDKKVYIDDNMFGDEEDDELFACISTQALEQDQGTKVNSFLFYKF